MPDRGCVTPRRKAGRRLLLTLAGAVFGGSSATAQAPVDSALLRYIQSIKAVDNHAHPMRPHLPGTGPDTEFDALPLDGLSSVPVPAMMRTTPENRVWYGAWQELYGYRYTDLDSAHLAELATERQRVMDREGAAFPAWVLDRLGIEVMLANRVAMGPGLDAPRFRWVAFIDALMYPLDTRGEERTPDVRVLLPLETRVLRRYLRESGRSAVPLTLDAYLRRVVTPTLERIKSRGALAVKFEAGYLRPLDFADAPLARAQRVYARYAQGGVPSHADYVLLQDYLFRYIAREAGRLGMAVHIHTIAGYGSYYSMRGSEPYVLEPTFDAPELRATTFVIIHGGWPLTHETTALLNKPNVYADMSAMDGLLPPTALAAVLREWLEAYPEKVLFGTDAFPTGPAGGWEDVGAINSTNARRALAIALTGMMADSEVDRAAAERLARMVMRDNAMALYHLGRQ